VFHTFLVLGSHCQFVKTHYFSQYCSQYCTGRGMA
jgi:hypothetical protein